MTITSSLEDDWFREPEAWEVNLKYFYKWRWRTDMKIGFQRYMKLRSKISDDLFACDHYIHRSPDTTTACALTDISTSGGPSTSTVPLLLTSCDPKLGSQIILNVVQKKIVLRKGDKFYFSMTVPMMVDRIVALATVIQDPINSNTDATIDVVLQFGQIFQEPIPRTAFLKVPTLVDLVPSKSSFIRVSDTQLPQFLEVIRTYSSSKVNNNSTSNNKGTGSSSLEVPLSSTPRADAPLPSPNLISTKIDPTMPQVQMLHPTAQTGTPQLSQPKPSRKRNTIEEYNSSYSLPVSQRIYFTTSSGHPISVFSLIRGDSRKVKMKGGKNHKESSEATGNNQSETIMPSKESGLFMKKETSYAHLLSSNYIAPPMQVAADEVDANGVPLKYDPMFLDNSELKTGKHRTVMNLPGYKVSIFPYIKKGAIKEELNEQFRQKHSWLSQPGVTLYKIRKLKRKLKKIALLSDIEMSTLALSYVLLEKLIIKNMISKPNCKLYASVCLLLAAKFNDPKALESLIPMIENIEKKLSITKKELLVAELSIFSQVSFGLFVDHHDVLPHYNRLKMELMGSDDGVGLAMTL
eukprot:gene6619-7694_t